jgi:hypothetical protein
VFVPADQVDSLWKTRGRREKGQRYSDVAYTEDGNRTLNLRRALLVRRCIISAKSIFVRRLTTVSEQYQDGAIGAVTSLYSCNKPLRKRIVREFTANVSSCNAFTEISGAQLLTRIICGWQVFERVFNCDETLVHPARLRAAIEKCLRWRLDYVTVAVKRRLSLSTGENVEQLQRHTRVRR